MSSHLAVEAALATTNWPMRPFRRVADLVTDRNARGDEPVLSVASVGTVSERVDGGRQASSESTVRNGWVARPGDLIVNPMWLIGGGIAVTDIAGAVSPDYRVYRFHDDIHPRFMHHLLRSRPYLDQYRLYTRAETTFDRRVSKDDFHEMLVPIPPLKVQRRVAEYLDIHADRARRMGALRRQQLDLLRERLAALYDEVLTPTAHDVTATPLRYLARIVDTEHKTAPAVPGGAHFVVRTSAIRRGAIIAEQLYETDKSGYREWTARAVPRPGDVLLTREAPVGEAALVRPTDGLVCIGQRVVLVRADATRLLPAYLLFVLLSPTTQGFYQDVTQGSLHPHLNMSDIARLPVPLRPIGEQRKIVARLDEASEHAARLTGLLDESAQLISQRTTALITAAVTGQFDVTTAGQVA